MHLLKRAIQNLGIVLFLSMLLGINQCAEGPPAPHAAEPPGLPPLSLLPPTWTALREGKRMQRVAVARDESLLAASADGTTLELLDGTSGALVRTLTGPRKSIQSLAFSPDGSLLAAGDAENVVWLWDLGTGDTKHVLRGHQNWVRDVAFSPDGSLLASVSDDRALRLWNAATGASVRTFTEHPAWVMKVVFSVDGTRLISGDRDGLVIVRDMATGQEVWRTTGGTAAVKALAAAPQAPLLGVGTADGTVRLYDMARGQLTGEYKYDGSLVALLFVNQGDVLVIATTQQLDFLAVQTGAMTASVTNAERLLDAAVTPGGRLVLALPRGLYTAAITPAAIEALGEHELQTLPTRVALLAQQSTQAREQLRGTAQEVDKKVAEVEKQLQQRHDPEEERVWHAVRSALQHASMACTKATEEALRNIATFTAQLQPFSRRVDQTPWVQRHPLRVELVRLERSLRDILARAQAPCRAIEDLRDLNRLKTGLYQDMNRLLNPLSSAPFVSPSLQPRTASRPDVPLERTARDVPHDGLFTRRNNFFGTQLTGGLSDLINQGVLIDQDTIRFDDFVAAWTHGIPTPPPGRALAVSYGIAPIPPHQRRHPDATHYLEIALRTAAEAPLGHPQIQQPTINYVFVVDKSGSMGSEAKMGSVKRSIASVLEHLRPDDRVGVVAFDDKVQTVLPSTRKSTLNMAQASTALSALQASGGTDIRLGLTFGLAELEGLPEDAIRQILLFSDGNPTSGVTDWLEIRRQIAEKTRSGSVISVFAYGSDANREELDKLAGLTGGHSTDIVDPSEALVALRKQLQRRDKIAALNLQVQLRIAPDIRVLHFFGHDLVTDPVQRAAIEREVVRTKETVQKQFGSASAPDIFQEAQGIRIVVPNLAVGETYWLAFELAVPNDRQPEEYGKVLVQYFDTFVRQNARSEVHLPPRGHISAAYVPFHALALAASEQVYYALTDLYQNDLQTARGRIDRFIKVLEGVEASLAPITLQPTELAGLQEQVRRDRSTLRKFVALAENLGKPLRRSEQLQGPSGYLTWGLNEFGRTRGGLLLNIHYSY